MRVLRRVWSRIRRFGSCLKRALPGWWDLHVYGGIGLVSYAVGTVWLPGGLMVLGGSLAGLGIWFYRREGV